MKKHTWLIALLLTVAVAASLFLVGCTPAEQQSVTPPGTEQEEPQGGDPGGGDEVLPGSQAIRPSPLRAWAG